MKTRILAIELLFASAIPIFGQGSASAFADAFNQLGKSTVYNIVVVSEPANPRIAILYGGSGGFGLALFSVVGDRSKATWKLGKVPDYMSVLDPANLRVTVGDEGPVILLHGCARHLCGGKGLAGAIAYDMDSGRMCSVYASWSSTAHTAKIVYEPEATSDGCKRQVELLNSMLRVEGYNP